MYSGKISLIVLASLITMAISYARRPAVEDYIGIPPNHEYYEMNDDLKGMVKFEGQLKEKVKPEDSSDQLGFSLGSLLFLMTLLALPFASWFLVARQMDKKEKQSTLHNIEVLAQYQKGKNNYHVKAPDEDEQEDQDFPKAS